MTTTFAVIASDVDAAIALYEMVRNEAIVPHKSARDARKWITETYPAPLIRLYRIFTFSVENDNFVIYQEDI